MAGKSYSAGRIFLQVVPSFKNLHRDIGREVKKANTPLEKQQEEIGKKHEEARERGASKVRARSADQQLRDQEKLEAAQLRQFQRFSQMLISERVKQSQREEGIATRNAKRQGQLELEIGRGRIKQAERLERVHAKSLQAQLAARLQAEKDAQRERTRIAEAGEQERQRLARKNLSLEIKDIAAAKREEARLAREAADAEARFEARNEARRAIIRRRRINQRLADLRAEENARRRLAGGEVGSRIRKGVQGAADAIGVVKITADSSAARTELAALRERLLLLSKQEIGIDIDATAAMAEIEAVQGRLQALAKSRDVEIDVDVNASAALVSLKRIESQVDQINRKRLGGGISGWFAGMRSSAEDGANSFRIFNPRILALVTLLPALAPLLASTAAGLGAIGTAAIGGAAGLGVMILGFTGISDAVSAMGDVQDNAAKDTLAAGKTIRNALRSIRDSEQGVDRARQQAARGAEDATRRVMDARRSLADAERTVARQIRDALRAQADAERGLADAQKRATDAQQDLMEARRRAQRDQDDLADRIKSGQLDERQALIDLFNAQVAYNAAIADGGTTNLEREEAAIALERARLAIKGIRQENKDLAAEQKKGVAGDENLAAAQERARDAIEAQTRAQRDVADAAQATRDARIDGAQRIADAERSVSDALRDQREQAVDSAIAIRDAEERLRDSQLAYQEALTQTGEIGSGSMQKLEEALGKLSPAGREFARFIFGLRDGFYDLRAIVQEGMLPGVQEAMEGIIRRYGPEFKAFMATMGATVGAFFITFGEALRSPVMVDFFETMARFAPTFFTQFGNLFINLMKLVAGLATAFAPFAKDFMDGFVDMAAGWAEWAAGLAGSDGFNAFIEYVKLEGPRVLELIKNIFLTLLNVGIGLSQTGVFDVLTGFFETLANMDPGLLATIVQGILGLMIASQVSAGINSLIISLMLLTGTVVGLVTLGLASLVVGFVYLWNNVEPFREGVKSLWGAIQDATASFVNWVRTEFLPWFNDTFLPAVMVVWEAIKTGAIALWEAVRPTLEFIGAAFMVAFGIAKWAWDHILFPVLEGIGNLLTWLWTVVIQPTLRIIWEAFTLAFRIIAAAWNNIGLPIIKLIGLVLYELWDGAVRPVLGLIGAGWSALWDNVLQPIFKDIGDAVTGAFNAAVWAWDNILKPMFEALAQALEGDFAGAAASAVKAFEGIWAGLGRIAASPINFIIGTVLNEGLFAAFNRVMEFLGASTRIPMLDLVDWGQDKGYTGLAAAGSKRNNKYAFASGGVLPGYTPGLDVHTFYSPTGGRLDLSGGEAIMRPEFTRAVGGEEGIHALNAMARKGNLPWQKFAIGGMVKPVNAAPSFGWGRYPSGRRHRALDLAVPIGTPVVAPYPGRVIDDGWDPTGFGNHLRLDNNGAGEGSYVILGHLLRDLVSIGQEIRAGQLIAYSGNSGNSTGPHVHVEFRTNPYGPDSAFNFTSAFNGGRSVTPQAGRVGIDLPWWADAPLDFLQGTLTSAVGLIPASGAWGSLMKAVPNAMFAGFRSFVGGMLGSGNVGEDDIHGGSWWNGREVPNNGTMMFDNGGYLQPGVTQVLNMTGRPEPVFTADQFERGGAAGGRGPLIGEYAPTFMGSDLTAADVMEDFTYTLARVDHGGKFAGRSH